MEGCMGEESFQMWELNRRLEAYLTRVKALEEQNELLSAELGGLRAQSGDASWRARADEELAALRALVDQRWREKHAAEVERDNLAEELEGVAGRCQQLRLARERTAEEAARSRRAVEAEKCAQGWLSTQAAELERELEALRAAHEEERAGLNAQAACAPRCPAPPRGAPAPAPEVEELAKRLGEAWRGAVRGYQERVAHMETSLGQARERLGRAVQGAREGRLELQQLRAERGGLQERRAALEQRLEGRWQERLRATEKFQLAVEALEQEKQGLQSQIAQVLEGRQQLAHLKMSLSLEVATYRTLLEAENSRLQTPGGSSKATFSFQDPKLELHFPGTAEGRHLGPLLPVLSPTPLPSPVSNTIETPVPAFLKSQEFLQARTPTLASTPIPPTPQAPCPATNAEDRAQDAPISQGGKQQAPEPLYAEAKVTVPATIPPGPEEPGGKQQEARPGQLPEDPVSLAPPLISDYPSLEAKVGEPSGSRMSSIFQEEGEGQVWGVEEKEAAIEVKVASSLQQETQQEEWDLAMKEIQSSHGHFEKETLKALGEEIQMLPMSLENQSHETLEENHESLRSSEEENLDTKSLEENQELLKSLEEKEVEGEGPLEKEAPLHQELPKPVGKEDLQMLQSLGKENQELIMSPESNLQTGIENQELVRSLEEENSEPLRALEKESQQPLKAQEAGDSEAWRSLAKENQESLQSLENEVQETFRPLEKENQEPLKSLGKEDQKIVGPLEKENQEPLNSVEEEEKIVRPLEQENQEPLNSLEEAQKIARPLEKENQELLRSPEEEIQNIVTAVEKENQETLRSLEEDNQETLRSLVQETQQPLKAVEEDQMALRALEKVNSEPLKSLERDQEIVKSLVKENQELFKSLDEESVEAVRSLETENLESLKSAGKKDLEILKPLEAQESLWSLEEMNRGSMESLGKELQEPLGLMDENQETLRPLEKKQEALKSLSEANLEALVSPEGAEKESQRDGEEEESPEEGASQESLRSQEEEGQELPHSANQPRWEDMVRGNPEPGQDPLLGRAGVENEDGAELGLREQDQKEETIQQGAPLLGAKREAWNLGDPDPQEQRVPAEGASGKGGTESPQDPEEPPEQAGTPGLPASQGLPVANEPLLEDKDVAAGSDQASPVVTLGSEADGGERAARAKAELGLEQEGIEPKAAGCLAPEEVMQLPLREEDVEAKKAQDMQWPGKDLEEADVLEAALSELPRLGGDSQGPCKGWEEPELVAPQGTEEVLPGEPSGRSRSDANQPRPPGTEEDETAQSVLGGPGPRTKETQSPTPILEDAPGSQPLAEGSQEVGWGPEGRAEALGKVEDKQEEFGAGEISEVPQEEGEDSREESEEDELGETLPDSTPLGLFFGSPASPRGNLEGEQRPSPQGEAREESWGPTILASKGLGAPPSEEEDGKEERGRDSDLSEEFEDLGIEASLLPGVPREVAEPLGQVPQLLEAAGWDRDGESDGFADEEESGEEEEGEEEEGEEEAGRKPGALQWGLGSSEGSLQALSSSPRGDFLEPEAVGVSVPWDGSSSRGAMADVPVTALEPESQGSAEASGSEEESDSVPLEREDQGPGPLETHRGIDIGLGAGDTFGVNGQGPNLEESEHVNGRVVNGLEQSEGAEQGTWGAPDRDQGLPLQEEEGGALKTPWAGAPVHVGPGQFLKFTQREGDGDSWSSGED